MSAESQRQRPTDDDQQLEHVPIVAGAGPRINSDEFGEGQNQRFAKASAAPVPTSGEQFSESPARSALTCAT